MGRQRGMRGDIVGWLTSFGFTVNQAKVYLSIVQSGRTHVGKISKDTQLYRQDIYRLLPKLEKMGLITKTIDKPYMIEALPVDKALETIVQKEKEKVNQKITYLERNLKEIVKTIQQQPAIKEEAHFTLLTTSEAVANRVQLTFKKKVRTFFLACTVEILESPAVEYFKESLQTVAEAKAKSRVIIVGLGERKAAEIAREIAPKDAQLTVKWIEKCASKNYEVIDDKEVWIGTQQKTQSGYPCLLWTNDLDIVESYHENFIETWKNPKATIIYSKRPQNDLPVAAIQTIMPTAPLLS